jgi:hypothetical protein
MRPISFKRRFAFSEFYFETKNLEKVRRCGLGSIWPGTPFVNENGSSLAYFDNGSYLYEGFELIQWVK